MPHAGADVGRVPGRDLCLDEGAQEVLWLPSLGLRSKEDRACQRVHLGVRSAPFSTFIKTRLLAEPTFDVEAITQTA